MAAVTGVAVIASGKIVRDAAVRYDLSRRADMEVDVAGKLLAVTQLAGSEKIAVGDPVTGSLTFGDMEHAAVASARTSTDSAIRAAVPAVAR
jgi:hypothetical protein